MKWTVLCISFLFCWSAHSQNAVIDSLKNEIASQNDNLEKADSFIKLGENFRDLSADSTLFYYNQATLYFDTTEQSVLSTKYYYRRAEVYLDIGKHNSAWESLEKAMNDSVSEDSPISTADILDKKADVKIRNGEYSDATDLLMEAVSIFERNQDFAGLGAAFNSLGTVMERSKKMDRALDYYEKAYDFNQKAGNSRPAHGALVNMAIIHSMQGDHEKAVPLLEKVIDYSKDQNQKRMEALASGNLGRVYTFLEEFGTAEVLISRSLELFRSMGHNRGVAAASSQLSRVYISQGKNQEAIDLLRPQYEFVKEQNFAKFQEHIADNLKNAYRNIGDYQNALFFTEELSAIKDSTVTKEMAQAVNDAETKYQTEKKEAEINRLALEDEINQIKINQQRYALLGFAFILALLSFFFYRLVGQKKEIDKKNKEKEVLLKEIHHRVKNNLQVISSLLKLQSRNVSDTATQRVLAEGQSRVRSMALIHQNLYQDDNLTGIHMPSYLKELSEELADNYSQHEQKISLNLDVDNIHLDVDTVVPIGLIINELMTNSLKYAFDNIEDPEIMLKLKKEKSGLRLIVKDNGVGYDPEATKKGSLGMRLINSFAKRLKAEYRIDGAQGVEANFLIKDYS